MAASGDPCQGPYARSSSVSQEPVSFPAISEMQGDFGEMQGGTEPIPAKSCKISVVWMQSPYSGSRETMLLSRDVS
jgi:hypothetical protein